MLSRTISSRARMKQARRAELALVLDILPLYIQHPWVHHLANILSDHGADSDTWYWNTRKILGTGSSNQGKFELGDLWCTESWTLGSVYKGVLYSTKPVHFLSHSWGADSELTQHYRLRLRLLLPGIRRTTPVGRVGRSIRRDRWSGRGERWK